MAKKHIKIEFGKVTEERKALPFIGEVIDLSYPELLKLRIAIRERCLEDKAYRAAIVQMCEMDCAFFIAVFGYFHETRATEPRQGKFPVHLDPDQADILACFQKYGGLQDITCEKSRGIGVSYLAAGYATWILLFHPGGKIELGLLSKDEDALDTPRRPSSFMGKVDLLLEELPAWMTHLSAKKKVIHRVTSDHRFENLLNGNALLGFVPTNDKLRSARLFALLADESAFLPFNIQKWLASTHGTTPSVFYISTHEGTNGLFYRLTQNTTQELIRISSWWWENRRCRRGLYQSVNGQIEIIDLDYKFPLDYEFSHKHAPLLRSPWADRQFNRPEADPITVLQELYGVAIINMRKLFQRPSVEAAKRTVKGPVWRGTITTKGAFIEQWEDAPVYVFRPIEALNKRYVIACDPANGVPGGAYGAISVIDEGTGEQVISCMFTDLDAPGLAQVCVELSKALGRKGCADNKIAFETTGGVGASFEKELRRLNFPEALWHPYHNKDRGEAALMELSRALRDEDFVLRDQRIFDELGNFCYENKGLLEYTGRDGHGDGTVAAAIGWDAAKSLVVKPLDRANQQEPEYEPEVLEARRKLDVWSRQFED